MFTRARLASKGLFRTACFTRFPLVYRVFILLALFSFVVWGGTAVRSSTIPTISIERVVADQTVTIRTHNFPAGYWFTVTMGHMFTRGVNGTVVGEFYSGRGGSFTQTFAIPDQLKGSYRIAIRTQTAHANPYYSYNWFYNNSTAVLDSAAAGPASAARGSNAIPVADFPANMPAIRVTAVEPDRRVLLETSNFPPNETFIVTMGPMYTRGIRGTVVGLLESGEGERLTAAFDIPAELYGHDRISIRAETAHETPYYGFNWFYNREAAPPATTIVYIFIPGSQTGPPPVLYTGIPTFMICGVVRDQTVTIRTHNYPPNQTFRVTMGPMFTQGIGGYVVGTIESGNGGSFTRTFNIPPELRGAYRISIRAETAHANPYYSYNWFYNNTATVC